MSNAPALPFLWDGESFVPLKPRAADKYYVVGQQYWMIEQTPRSQASHDQQFAWLQEAWQQLPEKYADLYPSPDHLRYRALIDCGYYDETIIDAGSNAAALRVATAIQGREPFALVIVRGPAVVIRTAKSQKKRLMGAKLFQESKQAILEHISQMIDVAPEALQKNAGKAA